jgi:DNA sulfur modification protein DndD
MIFTRLTINNFGVYVGQHEFELRPLVHGDQTRPVVLFGGKNGAGKTTILEAIRLCLYGRGALGTRVRRTDYETFIKQRFHRGARQRSAVQSASVGLIIEHTHAGVRSTYDAVRSWRIEAQSVHETISIFKDGHPLQEIAPEHWNDFLRDLIPPGVAGLFFFDGEQIQTLADEERESEALATAVRGLLNLDLVDRLRTDLHVYLRQQTQQHRSRLQQAVVETEDAYNALEQRYLERKQDRAQLRSQLDRTLMQLDKARQALLREGAGFMEQRAATELRQKEVARSIEQTHAAMRELAAGLLPFAVTPAWCERLHHRLELEATAERARLTHEAQQAQAAQVAVALLDPQFQGRTGAQVQPQDWANIAGAVQALLQPSTDVQSLDVRHPLAEQDRRTLQNWIETATQHVPQQLHALATQLETLEAERSTLEQALRQIPDAAVANPLLDEFNHLSEFKGALDAQMERLDEELHQGKRELDDLDRQRSRALQQLAAAGDADQRVERAVKVQVALEQYLAKVTMLKVQELERALADYFNLLCRKQMLVREVRIDPQTFTVELYGENRAPLRKDTLSAGEKQLYAMALLWALRSVSGRALPIIIDSPMGRLDSEHRATMLTHFFPNAAHQVVLLSTDTEIDGAAFAVLQHAVSHTFRLEWSAEEGATQVQRGYFAVQPDEVLA